MSSGGITDPDATWAGDLDTAPAPNVERAPGSRVDRYVITSQIGSGSMGVVYRAHDPSLDRVVALKLLHPSTRTDRRRSERLLGEAKALARVSGPNVVAVYDLGTEGKDLYIAMEFVEGTTLSTWLKAKRRTTRELLTIFSQAARGLATAHAADLVHGDFKPTNVMVDAAGRGKVLDFGLARPADLSGSQPGELDGTEPELQPGRLVGTPGYMAPEIFEGKALTAKSDQFAFCVALWEAVFGERPFSGATVLELTASVLHGRPPSPPAGSRVPRWLTRTLQKGMARDPRDRWPSMTDLVAHLEVDRRRRRRVAVLAALGVSTAATLGFIQTRPDARERCESEARNAIAPWGEAQREVLRAAILESKQPYAETVAETVDAEVAVFLSAWEATYVTTCIAPDDVMPATTRRRAHSCLSERREQYIAVVEALRNEPSDAAEKGAEVVGQFDPVATCSDMAYLQYYVGAPEDPELANRVAYEEGRLAAAAAAHQVGQFETAREVAEQVSDAAKDLEFTPLEVDAKLTLAASLSELGRYDESRQQLRSAYAQALAADLPQPAATAATRLASVEGRAGNSDKAREWGYHAQAHLRRPGMPETMWGNFHSTMGQVEGSDQRLELAIEHLEAALAISRKKLGDEHWVTALRKAALAGQLRRRGEAVRARELQESALSVLTERLGAEHPRTGMVENNLGLTLIALGESEAAINHLARALDIFTTNLPVGHPSVAFALTNLSSLELNVGDEHKALQYCQRALAQREQALSPEHPHVGYTLVDCGDIQRRLGRHEDALASLGRAREIAEAQGDPNHPGVAVSLVPIGRTLTDMGRFEEAAVVLERALDLLDRPREEYGQGERALAEVSLAHAQWQSGETTDAVRNMAKVAIESLQATPAAADGALARDLQRWRSWLSRLPQAP